MSSALTNKRAPVDVGSYLISPEGYRISSFMMFGLILLVCVILTQAFADVPENTELKRAFGYNNACVYLDYPPAAQIAPTLWILFLIPWTIYSLSWMTRCWSRVKPNGPVSLWVYRVLQASTVFELLCAVHFIQCFANKPHDLPYPQGLKMHTYPFTLLIVAMWLMSFKSAWWFTNHEGATSRGLKIRVWLFEVVYLVLTSLKVMTHINFFLDRTPFGLTFSRLVDAGFTVMAACLVPIVSWLAQYRIGDRIRVDLHVVNVVEGEYNLCRPHRGPGFRTSSPLTLKC